MKPIALFLVFSIALCCYAQDIRSKVAKDQAPEQSTDLIDPDAAIYGVPYGTTEEEFIAKFGMPIGYLRLSAGNTAMLYGKSHAFLFFANKLVGVRITNSVVDWKLSQDITGQGACDVRDTLHWKLTNGIRQDMSLAEVKNILGQSLTGDRYQTYYETKTARVDLDMAHCQDEGDTDAAYKVTGILIRSASQGRESVHARN